MWASLCLLICSKSCAWVIEQYRWTQRCLWFFLPLDLINVEPSQESRMRENEVKVETSGFLLGNWMGLLPLSFKRPQLKTSILFACLVSRLWEQTHFITSLVLGAASLVLKHFQTLLATLSPFPLACKDILWHFLQLSNLPFSSSFEIGSQAGALRCTQPASHWTISSELLWSANLGCKWKSEAEISLADGEGSPSGQITSNSLEKMYWPPIVCPLCLLRELQSIQAIQL